MVSGFSNWFRYTLIIYLLYAGLFILGTSVVIDGVRYFTLFDDAMISMRYAANAAHHGGLVWNPGGERVEGFTNPLWVAYMALFHLLPISSAKTSLFIQLSGALLVVLNLVYVKRIADRISAGAGLVAPPAVVLTAFYFPLNYWSLQGTEVGVLTLLVTASVFLALESLSSPRRPIGLYFVLGVATLVRIDMAVPAVCVLAVSAYFRRARRWPHLLAGLGIVALFLGLQTALRLHYYHEPLPNTYYLKMTGFPALFRMSRGFLVASEFLMGSGLAFFAAGIAGAWFRRDAPAALLLSVFLGQLAYSIYVGGDAWENWGGSNRYVSVAMPCLFILLGRALADFAGVAHARLAGDRAPRRRTVALLTGFSLIAINSGLKKMPVYSILALFLLRPALHVIDDKEQVRRALIVKRITTPEATVAVTLAGIVPYFSERPAIDFLGKNDKVIARLPMRSGLGPSSEMDRFSSFYPGHLKWDYAHSIGRLKPDVIVHGIWGDEAEAEPFLVDYEKVSVDGFPLWVRKESRAIRWDEINARE